jgi:hypothetical protein
VSRIQVCALVGAALAAVLSGLGMGLARP